MSDIIVSLSSSIGSSLNSNALWNVRPPNGQLTQFLIPPTSFSAGLSAGAPGRCFYRVQYSPGALFRIPSFG
jgi:hypothetical protein